MFADEARGAAKEVRGGKQQEQRDCRSPQDDRSASDSLPNGCPAGAHALIGVAKVFIRNKDGHRRGHLKETRTERS
jgi:hypothetical protein